MRYFLLALLLFLALPAHAAPQVVVSIAPLHSLVCAVTRGISAPQLLLDQGGSPHSASLRPSQARALAEADLLVWVGPELESFLAQPIANLAKPGAELRLLALDNLQLLPQRAGGLWEGDAHELHSSGHDERHINPHLWLAPNNAARIAQAVASRLEQLDPQHAAGYRQNLARLQQRISALQARLSAKLKPLRGRPYLVFHDAYPYFERAFGLDAIGSVRISPERAPGARRLQQIQVKIARSGAVCLFSEPQFSPALARRLAAASGIRLGELDPLGSTLPRGENAWFELMENLARNLASCLAPAAP